MITIDVSLYMQQIVSVHTRLYYFPYFSKSIGKNNIAQNRFASGFMKN